MRKMRRYRDFLIEELADRDKALSFLEVALEEYEKDPDGAALYYGFSAAVEAQGGVQKFAMKTHSAPQAVSDALLSKDEIQIAELLKKQVLARRGKDKDIAQNEPLPKGWREVKLGEISKFSKGSGITKNEVRDKGVPCIRYGELYTKHNLKVRNFYSFISNKDLAKRKLIKNNDLLFAGSGETREEIGKCASFNHDIRAYAGGDVIICSLDPKEVRADFASCYLNTIGRKQINRLGQGNSIVHIYSRYLEDVVIPLPSIEEQKAIASLLEKWDTAIEKTEALIEAKEKWFKWLLKTLISDQQDNPEWREVKLGELCSDIAYGYTATASNEPIGPKFLRITDIVSDSINWESVPYCEIEDSKKHRYTLETGDIVIARTGATTGYNQVVRSNEHSVFASYLIRYKLRQDIAYPFFIGCVLKSTYWKRFVERIKARSAQPGANAKDFASFKIFLPTFPEQERIANILDTAKKEIEFLKQLAEQYRTQKRGLMQKLLTGKWRVRNQ